MKGYADQYIFLLMLCYKPTCVHPRCKAGKPVTGVKWFDNGLKLSVIPMPVKDPNRPWGGQCNDCKEGCSGHYLSAEESIELATATDQPVDKLQPPSAFLKTEFLKLKDHSNIPESMIERCARETLLRMDEVRIWFDHLKGVAERRKAGAAKAAATRAAKKCAAATSKYIYFKSCI